MKALSFSLLLSVPLSSTIASPKENDGIIKFSDAGPFWFDAHDIDIDRLIWMNIVDEIVSSSDLSYGDHFLSNEEHLPFDIHFDLFYIDNIQNNIYIMLTDRNILSILQYHVIKQAINELYHLEDINTHNDAPINILRNCNHNICSLYVDVTFNVMYFTTESGYIYLDLNTMDFGRFLYDENNDHWGKITTYKGDLYHVIDSAGIIKTALTNDGVPYKGSSTIFVDQKSVNNEQITSFIIDRYREMMYFSTDHHIYYIKMNSYYNISSEIDLNINLNASAIRIHSLEINTDGTMLFIQYNMNKKQYIVNWPTSFGCTACVSISVPLHSTKNTPLYYYASPRMSAKRHASTRKLLTEFTVTSWNISNSQLITADYAMAIGHYNNSIFLIGGSNDPFQVTEYDINTKTIIDHGSGPDVVVASTYGTGQYYTQFNDSIFMIDPRGTTLSMYNLKTKHFKYNWNGINIPMNVLDGACLTAIHNYIFIIGGISDFITVGRNDVQILNLSTNEWFEGARMQEPRASFSCNVHPVTMTLYAIGGVYEKWVSATSSAVTVHVTQIESINIEDIATATWRYLDQQLLPIYGHNSVVFGHYIMIIGGFDSDQTQRRIQMINCMDESVTTGSGVLRNGVYQSSAIIVHNIIYVFGGRLASGDATDTIQYTDLGPTFAPTLNPTASIIPTLQPTYVPSIHPTPCWDFDALYPDDKTNPINIEDYSNYYQLPSITDSYMIYYGDEEHKYYLETITCSNSNNDDIDFCYVLCFTPESCTHTSIVATNTLLSFLLICDGRKSCANSNVMISNIHIDNIVIICNSSLSCNNMHIDINNNESLPLQSLNIHCIESFSCFQIDILINGQSSIQHDYNDYFMICAHINSCRNMILIEKDINVTMIMFAYSDDVRIINDIGFTNDYIICGAPSDIKYIKYSMDDYRINAEDIYILVESMYEFNKFQCEDITYQCTDYVNTFCEISYEFISPTTLIQMDYTSHASCYDINIAYLQNIVCVCDSDVKDAYKYAISVEYKYNMIFNASSNCDSYFGDGHSTQVSLSLLNELFTTTLKFYKYHEYIDIISIYPNTNISSNMSFSDCVMNNIEFSTHFQVFVTNPNANQYLFSHYSLFYNQSIDLLFAYFEFESILFDIYTEQSAITSSVNSKNKFKKYIFWIQITTLSLIFCIVLISLILYWKYRNKEKSAMELSNPMVILIGIGTYDDDDIENLNVDKDIENLRSLFRSALQYETVPKYQQENPKLHWTQQELTDLFEKKAAHLQANITKYDGLILVISSHGINNNIISSDYELMDKTAIHRIFSTKYPKVRNIPRIMIYDCCDEERDEMDGMDEKDESQAKTYTIRNITTESVAQNTKRDKNRDYKLATIDATKMRSSDGSYIITKFVEKTLNAINNENEKFLYQILDDIKDELGVNKQQIICSYNNATRFVKFMKREIENKEPAFDTESIELLNRFEHQHTNQIGDSD